MARHRIPGQPSAAVRPAHSGHRPGSRAGGVRARPRRFGAELDRPGRRALGPHGRRRDRSAGLRPLRAGPTGHDPGAGPGRGGLDHRVRARPGPPGRALLGRGRIGVPGRDPPAPGQDPHADLSGHALRQPAPFPPGQVRADAGRPEVRPAGRPGAAGPHPAAGGRRHRARHLGRPRPHAPAAPPRGRRRGSATAGGPVELQRLRRHLPGPDGGVHPVVRAGRPLAVAAGRADHRADAGGLGQAGPRHRRPHRARDRRGHPRFAAAHPQPGRARGDDGGAPGGRQGDGGDARGGPRFRRAPAGSGRS